MNLSNNIQIPSISIGGVILPLSIAKVFQATASANQYDTLRENGVQYQVPVGFKLVIAAYKITAATAALTSATLGSATAAVSNGAVPAGSVLSGAGLLVTAPGVGALVEAPTYHEFSAGRFPYILGTSVPYSTLIGYLVAV